MALEEWKERQDIKIGWAEVLALGAVSELQGEKHGPSERPEWDSRQVKTLVFSEIQGFQHS